MRTAPRALGRWGGLATTLMRHRVRGDVYPPSSVMDVRPEHERDRAVVRKSDTRVLYVRGTAMRIM